MKRRLLAVAAVLVLAAVTNSAPAASDPVSVPKPRHNKTVVLQYLAGLNRHDLTAVDRTVSPRLVQHDPLIADGPTALRKSLAAAFTAFPRLRYHIKRAAAGGNYVAVHSHVTRWSGDRGYARADLYRLRNGQITEMWAVSQDVPPPSPVGHDMFSTLSQPHTAEPDPTADTTTTTEVATGFFSVAVIPRRLDLLGRYVHPHLYQHNPGIPDGADAVSSWLQGFWAKYPETRGYVTLTVSEGDLAFVLGHVEADPGTRGYVALDIFRVRNTKAVEHWGVYQDVPNTSANNHPMY